ncbi:putative secreted protein with PEP-CTERM sorting signal [Pseudoduganella lurida]|uniref:Putative secreted protein with PEP-CTERM sorting signal n=1 Tax=Pseudoduganella lurida TaxID=1036180 RepID=A0A562RG05_9BURK|nr:MHFG family PEP-CTERM protein [Pseudoduganella lurida]TWI67360.1 putative secreted protein with PEP-CTERM sorting signal [Pseudoduganella lurida]
MSTLVAGAIAATAMLSSCSWNHPGRNPYRGNISEAVSRYVDIPVDVRRQLVAKMRAGQADDQVTITRDAILGKYQYDPALTSMHFGQRTVCDYVTRDQWAASAREPAAVYCVDEQCLIVPKICGNVSRVRRSVASAGGTRERGAAKGYPMPGWVAPRAVPASPDTVAVADALAAPAPDYGAEPDTFMSPFGGSGARTAGRLETPLVPDTGTETTPPVATPVPEPGTYAMFGAGLAFLAGVMRRRSLRDSRGA